MVFADQTHARVIYSCPRQMIGHFEKVGLSMTLENVVELGRPMMCFEWQVYQSLTSNIE